LEDLGSSSREEVWGLLLWLKEEGGQRAPLRVRVEEGQQGHLLVKVDLEGRLLVLEVELEPTP
jgi:hypothetical protein